MKKLTSALVLAAMAFAAAPAFAQNPLNVNTTPATCRCAVVPDKSTLAPASLAVDIQNDWVVVTLNQPANVQGSTNDGAGPVEGFQVWHNGVSATVSDAFLNGNEFNSVLKFKVKVNGQAVNLDTSSLVDVAYTPVAGKSVVGRYNSSLVLGVIVKTKIINGLKGDAECPTLQKGRYDEYVNGNMVGLTASEPLTNSSGGNIKLAKNGVASTSSISSVAGVTIAALSLTPQWADILPTDKITAAVDAGNNFKDHAGNSMCVEAPKTLEVLAAGTPTVDNVAPQVVDIRVAGPKIFKVGQKIPNLIATLSEPVASGATFWLSGKNGNSTGAIWYKFVQDPANPLQMIGTSFFTPNWTSNNIGPIMLNSALMVNMKDAAGNATTIGSLQQYITAKGITNNGGPSVVIALANYSGALKASIGR